MEKILQKNEDHFFLNSSAISWHTKMKKKTKKKGKEKKEI